MQGFEVCTAANTGPNSLGFGVQSFGMTKSSGADAAFYHFVLVVDGIQGNRFVDSPKQASAWMIRKTRLDMNQFVRLAC